LTPADPVFAVPAPERSRVHLETTKGAIIIEVTRAWAPRGADRFINLVRHGYYDEAPVFRIRPNTWTQFGIAGDPAVARAWRQATFRAGRHPQGDASSEVGTSGPLVKASAPSHSGARRPRA